MYACRRFTKHKQRIEKFIQTGDTNYIYRNDLDKACFAHDARYCDSNNLARRIASDKVLRNKAFKVVTNPYYNGYERALTSMGCQFFQKKKAFGSGLLKNEIRKKTNN